ncbi:hypothetical protein UPYG_G00308840 [Umbra pygmaea]|uniref:Zona pellucida sperm-binding protein 3 n=1 Tax=Umbra pygmaea TaxID=75934 RepID=A0ABD0W0W3_UMBPY
MEQLQRKCLHLIVLLSLVWLFDASLNELPIYRPLPSLSHVDDLPAKLNPRAPAQNTIQFPDRIQKLPKGLSRPLATDKLLELRPAVRVVMPPEHIDSVGARCGESVVQVEAKLDLFGTGQLVKTEDISLGGCLSVGLDLSAQVLLFESELHDCGSVLTMTEDYLIYAFALEYRPTPEVGSSVVRTNGATVSIECHYLRRHNVSSNTLKPTWRPYTATKLAEDSLAFSYTLMNDDWILERPSNVYFLGDMINVEVSVQQFHHVPMRVFVDSCVATMVPDSSAAIRYDFIQNHGCLTDALETGSSSHFLDRRQPDRLQLQLEAFRLQQQTGPNIYISCLLKAKMANAPLDPEHKACSFASGTNNWVGADGDDEVCSCCQTTCSRRKGRSILSTDAEWELDAMFGPLFIQESYVKQDQEAPAGASEAPAGASEAPAGASEAPAGASEAPAGASEAPAGASEAPAGASEAPAGASEAPAGASERLAPAGASEAPAGAQRSHVLSDQSTAGVSSQAVAMVGITMVLGLLCVVVLVTVLYRRNKAHTYPCDVMTDQ